jgi:hypothetical protein
MSAVASSDRAHRPCASARGEGPRTSARSHCRTSRTCRCPALLPRGPAREHTELRSERSYRACQLGESLRQHRDLLLQRDSRRDLRSELRFQLRHPSVFLVRHMRSVQRAQRFLNATLDGGHASDASRVPTRLVAVGEQSHEVDEVERPCPQTPVRDEMSGARRHRAHSVRAVVRMGPRRRTALSIRCAMRPYSRHAVTTAKWLRCFRGKAAHVL